MRMKRCRRCHKDFMCYGKELLCQPCREQAKEEREQKRKEAQIRRRNKEKNRDVNVSIIARLAREQGMSYGQYKAKQYMEREKR